MDPTDARPTDPGPAGADHGADALHPALLPLVVTAWSDGMLSTSELQAFGAAVDDDDGLQEDARRALARWLDPSAPPSPTALRSLENRIRALAAEGPDGPPSSLVDLGVRLARTAGADESRLSDGALTETLSRLEASLGVIGREAAAALIAPARAPSPQPVDRSPALDVEALRAYLDRPHGDVRRAVLEVLSRPPFPFPAELSRREHRDRVSEALRVLVDRGWGAMAYPEYAAGGGDPGRAMAIFETLAYGDLSTLVKFGVQFGLFGGSILHLGTRRHHERYLPDVGRLALPGCYAMTETGHGSNVREIETRARFDAATRELVIETPVDAARKDYIGGAAESARLATVFAQLEVAGERHGVHAMIVPLRNEEGTPLPGVHIEDCGPKEGLNGVDNGRLAFDGVRVPVDNLLDRFGRVSEDGRYESPIPSPGRRFFTMLGTLVQGRIGIGAASVVACKSALTIAIRYGTRRHQFGPAGEAEVSLMSYRAHRLLLLPRLATTYALHFALRDLASDYVRSLEEGTEDERRDVEARAAGLKAVASSHCAETLQACREACGGKGYLAENRLAQLKADTDVFTTFEGANAVLLQLVAKSVLSAFRHDMGDLDLRGVVRLLADRAQTAVAELNPLVTRKTDRDHLLSFDFHRAALRYREERLVWSAARRLKTRIDRGEASFDAMNACQAHLLALARAHVDRLTVDAFQDAVARSPAPGPSEALATLARLHALGILHDGRGWFLESGYLEPTKSKAIRRARESLADDVAEVALELVDAFGIPDEVLDAPIGRRSPGVDGPLS